MTNGKFYAMLTPVTIGKKVGGGGHKSISE